MRFGRTRFCLLMVFAVCAGSGAAAQAQIVPWDVFEDLDAFGVPISDSVCDVVNTDNAELVVLRATGQLVIVTGQDVTLLDTHVDADGFVTFLGDPAGFITFEDDGDGLRTLWWTTVSGRVVDVDEFTGEPFPTDLFPSDVSGALCDACPLWDDPTVCALPATNLPVTFNFCGANMQLSMVLTLSGLALLRFTRQRRRLRSPAGRIDRRVA